MANERVQDVVPALLEGIRKVIADRQVTPPEFGAMIEYLTRIGETGETGLLMAVFFEADVDRIADAASESSPSCIEGPYYIPDAPMLERPYVLPQREDEAGEPLIFSGTVRGSDGAPLGGALLDMWQADATVPGKYSHIHPGIPDYNLRGRFEAEDDGSFEVKSVMPAAYEIPNDGPTGVLLEALGRHCWRPAHLHLKVSHPGYESLTTQMYFEGGEWLDSDAANAVKGDLILSSERSNGSLAASYDFALQPAA